MNQAQLEERLINEDSVALINNTNNKIDDLNKSFKKDLYGSIASCPIELLVALCYWKCDCLDQSDLGITFRQWMLVDGFAKLFLFLYLCMKPTEINEDGEESRT